MIEEIYFRRGEQLLIYRPEPGADYYEIMGNIQGVLGEFDVKQQEELEEDDG